MSTTTDTDTRTRTSSGDTGDDLTHLLCQFCKREARTRAKPPRSLCGSTRYDWQQIPATSPRAKRMCVVCEEMTARACPNCGNRIQYKK